MSIMRLAALIKAACRTVTTTVPLSLRSFRLGPSYSADIDLDRSGPRDLDGWKFLGFNRRFNLCNRRDNFFEFRDYDFYVYSRQPVDVAFRDGLLRPRAQKLELHRIYWEEEDAWIDPDDTKLEIMYRTCAWTEGELTARLDRYEASLGYTTALCYNLERSRALWDSSGWFAKTQRRLLEGYPEGLARAIVRKNLPVLGEIISSYEQQIHAAFLRQDPVSLNHRVAAWLSSYFDILFAANR
jgi:hypothetical protein